MSKLVSNPNDTFLKKVPEKRFPKVVQLFAQDSKKFETKI